MGRGILDASKIERGAAPNPIRLLNVVNATISGIILRDPQEWTVVPANCDSVVIDNIKLIGLWRYNSDGIDVVNSRNITIKNTFIRAFDDNIALKGLKGVYDPQHNNIMENIAVDNCVLWNDWGRPIELGLETVTDTMRNISFRHCQVPHFTWIAIDIQNGDRGYVKDVNFEDISIEDPILDSITIGTTPMDKKELGKTIELIIRGFNMWTTDTIRGNIENIHFSNIRYNSDNPTFVNFVGQDSTHMVKNIYIRDYFINGKKITDQSSFRKNEFVKNVFLE
jgi:polygalacturonase